MRIVAVMSGKGGVGKTTSTVGLALALQSLGFRPAILDLDLENPSLAGRDGVTGLTRNDLSFPGELIQPPRWANIPVMSPSMLPPEDFEDTPALMEEEQKHFIIRHLANEVDWGDSEILIVDMPPGSGEEVRGLLQLSLDGVVIVTSPQRISEAAVRKVLVMTQEYRIPVVGLVENTVNGIAGEAGVRLADAFGLPLLTQVPWSEDIVYSMEEHIPFNHDAFLPVAHEVANLYLLSEPVTHTKRTPGELEALRLAELGELEPVPDNGSVPAAASSAQDLGIQVDAPQPWKIFKEFTDPEWEEIKLLLPEHMRAGRKRISDRAMLNGIFFVHTTRCRWADMPERFGRWETARSRMRRWKEEGIWESILECAHRLGYGLTEGDFLDDTENDAGSQENDDAGLLRDGDNPGEQERAGPAGEGEVPSSEEERSDPDSDPAAGSGAENPGMAAEVR